MTSILRSAALHPGCWIVALGLVGASCASPRSGPQDPDPDPQESSTAPAPVEEEEQEKGPLRRLLLSTGEVVGTPTSDSTEFRSTVEDTAEIPEDEEGGSFLVAPIPFHNPTVGYGLALGAAYLLELDEESPASVFGGGGFYAENGSLGGALAFKGYFDEDRYRLTAGFVATRLHFDFSTETEDVPLREDIVGGGLEFLVRSFERVYFGPQVVLAVIDTDVEREADAEAIPDDQLATTNIGLGLLSQRDTRDSVYYPREGSNASVLLRVFDESLGSPFSYQIVPVSYDHFLSLGEKDVLGLRASGRFAFGEVPFYGESYFGTNADLRGYAVGTLHDDTLLAGQAEYRRELVGRLGAVAFAGLGTVAPDLGKVDEGEALPSIGFGLRFNLEPENHVNLRLDFAWGEDQSAVYLGVGEAF